VEGKSYYLEEALGVKRVVEAVDSNVTIFAIFDEMFRGTNSEERIFAARRVLELPDQTQGYLCSLLPTI